MSALVLGGGWLGALLVPLLARDRAVTVVTRGGSRHAALREAGATHCLSFDLARDEAGEGISRVLPVTPNSAWLLLPPSALPEGDAGPAAVAALREALLALDVERAVMASSIGVYGDRDGGLVAADTPPVPHTAREHRLLALEEAWLGGGVRFRVARLAGLYGPGRVIGADTLRSGKAVPGAPDAWLNLVRGEDAAAALHAQAAADAGPRVALVSDGTPARRAAYYGTLAARLGLPAPRFDPDGARRGGSRRCDPAASWAALGLAPRYPDFETGLADLLP